MTNAGLLVGEETAAILEAGVEVFKQAIIESRDFSTAPDRTRFYLLGRWMTEREAGIATIALAYGATMALQMVSKP